MDVAGSNALAVVLNNLAYTLSFNEFANRYNQGSSVLTFDDVNNGLLRKIRDYTRSVENGVEGLKKDKVRGFIDEVRQQVAD